MYKVRIKTKYNTINMNIEDLNNPEFVELCDQPYILEVEIENIKNVEEIKNDLIKERDEALMHVVGTSYWNEVAQEKNKLIKKLK